jgi:hypothetical protein
VIGGAGGGDEEAGIGSEECFFRGSLRELLILLSSSRPNDVAGIPLDGTGITPFDEVTGTDIDDDALPDENLVPGDGTAQARECFPRSRDHHIGFTWFFPVDHTNEIYTDSVTFDLGFYTGTVSAQRRRRNGQSGRVKRNT